jgi:hypothetical protein
MRIWLQIGVFLLGIGLIQGQGFDQLDWYLGTGTIQNKAQINDQISNLVTKLNAKSKKSDRQFLMGVFNLAHRQFLKEYHQYSSFNNIFEGGQYDCVTATALYSLLLTELGYEHKIVETKYHIFILVESPAGQFLMESTDPINGFEYQKERINNRIAQYLADDELSTGQLNTLEKVATINTVTPDQLTGLLYYNQCVKNFNDNELGVANRLLSKAKQFYDSPRMQEMEKILRNRIALSDIGINSDLSRQVTQRQEP